MDALSGENAYLFRHAVTREAAYQLHLPTGRGRLHGMALDIIESLVPPQDRARFALELADHARAASVVDDCFALKESEYLALAAREDERTWRLHSAIELYRRAGRHPASPPQRKYHCLYRAAGLLTDLGQPQQAQELLDSAEVLGPVLGDPLFATRARLSRGRMAFVSGRHEQALELLRDAVQSAERAGDAALRREAMSSLASALDHLGRLDEALAVATEAIEVARAQGATAEVNRDTGNLAALLARLGRLDEAEDCMNRAIAGHRASGHLRFEGIVSGNMSLVKEIRGDPAAALTWQCRALACIRRIGDRATEGYMLGNLADLHRKQGRLEAALAATVHGGERLRESGMRNAELVLRRNLALAWLSLGMRDRAESVAASIETDVRDFDPVFRVRATVRLNGLLALAEPRRDLALARNILEQAEVTLRQAGANETSEAGAETNGLRRTIAYCEAGLKAHPGQWPLFFGFSPQFMSSLERLALWRRLETLHPDQARQLEATQPALVAAMLQDTQDLPVPDWRDPVHE